MLLRHTLKSNLNCTLWCIKQRHDMDGIQVYTIHKLFLTSFSGTSFGSGSQVQNYILGKDTNLIFVNKHGLLYLNICQKYPWNTTEREANRSHHRPLYNHLIGAWKFISMPILLKRKLKSPTQLVQNMQIIVKIWEFKHEAYLRPYIITSNCPYPRALR